MAINERRCPNGRQGVHVGVVKDNAPHLWLRVMIIVFSARIGKDLKIPSTAL